MTDILTDEMREQATLPKNAIERRTDHYIHSYNNAWSFFAERSDGLFKIIKWAVISIVAFLLVGLVADRLREAWQFIIEIFEGIVQIFSNLFYAAFGSGLSHVFWTIFIPIFLVAFVAMMPKVRSFLMHTDIDMTREHQVHINIYQKTEMFNEASLRCEPPSSGILDFWILKDIKRAVLNIFNRQREYKIVSSSYNTKNMLKCKINDYSGADMDDILDEGMAFFTTSCGNNEPVVAVVETEEGEEVAYIRSSRINNISQIKAIIEWPEKDQLAEENRKLNMTVTALRKQINDNIVSEIYPVVDQMLNRDDVNHVNALFALSRKKPKGLVDKVSKETKVIISKAMKEKEAEYQEYYQAGERADE